MTRAISTTSGRRSTISWVYVCLHAVDCKLILAFRTPLQSLLDKYPQPVARTFGEAVQRKLVEADQMRQSGNPNWSVRSA